MSETFYDASNLSISNGFGRNRDRYYLEEYFKQRPALNADIDQAYTVEVARAANRDFEVAGDNMTTALCTFSSTVAGITLTTAGADNDQAIVLPHLDTNQSAWTGVKWGTENQVEWECAIRTGDSIALTSFWAGLKDSNTGVYATDDNQAYFLYAADKMGFSKDECVVIEDSITGVTASVRAGIRVLGLVKMSSKEELIEAGAEPFTNMRELPKLLGL